MSHNLFRALLLLLSAALLPAQNPPDWLQPFPPHKIADNLYYVGSKGLASFLITTPQGHILINSSMAASVPLIENSIQKLGFRLADVKILLISHAHFDHCAGSNLIKRKTHALYMVMDADVPVVEDGGRSDFQYASRPDFLFAPAKVDRILHDGDTVQLAGVILTAHLTPGHTKGCTTWTMQVLHNGKLCNVVIVGSTSVNPGYKLVHNAKYPNIAQDYAKSFRTLESLKCDIFLAAHGQQYDLAAKYPTLAFVDPQGYRAFVADSKKEFETELQKQQASVY
jgi:metallo-beta-lactamase class B